MRSFPNRFWSARFLALLMILPGCNTTPSAVTATTVIVVRHAEKEPNQPDPGLTPAGQERAAKLADRCVAAGVNAIFSTPYKRTVRTAEPTADRLGLKVNTSFTPGAENALAEHIRGAYAGKSVLVVGHSNTVPLILAALGTPRIDDLPESAHDRLFLVTIQPDGTARYAEERYGKPTP